MTPDGVGGDLGIDAAVGQIVADLARSFPQTSCGLEVLDDPLDANDSRDSVFPVGIGDDTAGVEYRGGTGLVPVTFVLIDRLEGRGGRALGTAAFNLTSQGLLVRFQLDDQICASRGGNLKSFFDSGLHRA